MVPGSAAQGLEMGLQALLQLLRFLAKTCPWGCCGEARGEGCHLTGRWAPGQTLVLHPGTQAMASSLPMESLSVKPKMPFTWLKVTCF